MLELEGLNYWAVLAAWLINVIVGAFWYSPAGFGKPWGKATGVDLMKLPQKEANRIIQFVILSGLVQAFVLGLVLNTLGTNDAAEGLLVGLVLAFGFACATTVGNTLYQRLGWKFWWINASYFLLVMAVNSVIFAVWQ